MLDLKLYVGSEPFFFVSLCIADCQTNLGSGMDAKSGVFTAPLSGGYLFSVHVCAHDQHKALLTLRRNGMQVASFYDQVAEK